MEIQATVGDVTKVFPAKLLYIINVIYVIINICGLELGEKSLLTKQRMILEVGVKSPSGWLHEPSQHVAAEHMTFKH